MSGTVVTILVVAEVLWVLAISVWILLERRSPAATLAWLLAFAALPVLSLLVYVFFGARKIRRRRLRYERVREAMAHRRELAGTADADAASLSGRLAQLAALGTRAGEGPPLRVREAEILLDGDAAYAAIGDAVDAARHHVHLEYYIWEPGGVGTRLRDRLEAKAKEGVAVRILLDAFGSGAAKRRFWKPLVEAGGEVAWFNRPSLARFQPRLMNFRTHRKIVVCDAEIGFTGGMNVADVQSREKSGEKAWRDTHLRLEGDAVRKLQWVFLENWQYATGAAPEADEVLPPLAEEGESLVQVVASGPDHDVHAIQKLFFSAVAGAEERVQVTSPYFVPDDAMLTALSTAALRGVDVRVLVPQRSDSVLVTAAGRSYYEPLLNCGVRIFEYLPRMLHAKSLVVDRDLAVVGTANMDNRSFSLNFEVAAVLYGSEGNDRLAAAFETDLGHAREVSAEDVARVPILRRLVESFARLFSPLL
jgi:cardiolipin synthase